MTLQERLVGLGPFVGHPAWPDGQRPDAWTRLGEAVASTRWVEQLVERTRDALARGGAVDLVDVEDRVVASTAHLGVLARTVSPVVATAALTGRRLDAGTRVLMRFDGARLVASLDYDGIADDLGTSDPTDPDDPGGLAHTLVRRLLLPLGDTVERVGGLAHGIVLGNTASAMRGAVTVLLRADPEVGRRAAGWVEPLLGLPELAGAWQVDPGPPPTWRRRSCCLFYRLPGGGLCGDCALTRLPGT